MSRPSSSRSRAWRSLGKAWNHVSVPGLNAIVWTQDGITLDALPVTAAVTPAPAAKTARWSGAKLPFAAIHSAKLVMTDKLIQATAPLSSAGADTIKVEED